MLTATQAQPAAMIVIKAWTILGTTPGGQREATFIRFGSTRDGFRVEYLTRLAGCLGNTGWTLSSESTDKWETFDEAESLVEAVTDCYSNVKVRIHQD